MGVCPLPRLHMYWSKDKEYQALRIAELMIREQFEMLLECLRFCTYSNSTEKLCKIEKVLNLTTQQFKQAVTLGEDLVIDETMIPWQGRFSFCQSHSFTHMSTCSVCMSFVRLGHHNG